MTNEGFLQYRELASETGSVANEAWGMAWDKAGGEFWSAQMLDLLFESFASEADNLGLTFHHIGFLHNSQVLFDAATAGYEGHIHENKLIDPSGMIHNRKYIEVPSKNGAPVFIEHATLDGGGTRTGLHFDFVAPDDARARIARLEIAIKQRTNPLETEVMYTHHHGGFSSPVGKMGIARVETPKIDVAVMYREQWANPVEW